MRANKRIGLVRKSIKNVSYLLLVSQFLGTEVEISGSDLGAGLGNLDKGAGSGYIMMSSSKLSRARRHPHESHRPT